MLSYFIARDMPYVMDICDTSFFYLATVLNTIPFRFSLSYFSVEFLEKQ